MPKDVTRKATKTAEKRKVVLQNGKSQAGKEKDVADNRVITSKYTNATFLPLNAWEQFHKFGNCYFITISIVMFLGEKTSLFVGTIKGASTLGTLMMMMSFTAAVAWLDDRRRKKADQETNAQQVKKLAVSGDRVDVSNIRWDKVKVGDVLQVDQDTEFPADMVPLYCSGEDGAAFVSTANLDGETNLKQKAASAKARDMFKSREYVDRLLPNLQCQVEAGEPSADIINFSGNLQFNDQAAEPLDMKQLFLRGTMLKNTQSAIGLVVFTGKQTRMVMNSSPAPLKISNLERVTNTAMIVILIAQGSLALLSTVLFMASKGDYTNFWYLYPPDIILPDAIGYWLTFFVLYSNLMPISLYPTMEFCNLMQAKFIKNDRKMYYEMTVNGEVLQCPPGVRSSNLCQELGQVSYIFSDKTGTLTQNVMELKRLSISGRKYGKVTAQPGFSAGAEIQSARGSDPTIDELLEVLAVCHTVAIGKGKEGEKPKFEAESPDELALVAAVNDYCGWKYRGKVKNTYKVQLPGGQDRLYEIIAINAFDSTRKRMSVIVKTDAGQYHLFAKGADSVMMEIGAKERDGNLALNADLNEFAREGLRTLVIGRKTLDQQTVNRWMQKYNQASLVTDGREQQLAAVAGEIESGLRLVGATAIEDKLQDDVQGTIVKIREAGIKLWVLTGDKLETAREIGFSTKVLTPQMNIQTLDSTGSRVKDDLERITQEVDNSNSECGMMVTGAALQEVQKSDKMSDLFLDVAQKCSVLIACRVSPAQKADMVKLVRLGVFKRTKQYPVTLAVGDGANDVPMIQEAQVGVGINGREGRQAVNNSDFSIGQFRFLQRLLLVHGRWNYRRTCKFTLFTFWRNMVSVLLMFYFSFMSGYSGTSIFEDWIRLSFNFLCSFPIMATGVFDKDVREHIVLQFPKLYKVGRLGLDLSAAKTAQCLLAALVHSIIILAVTGCALRTLELGNAGDYYTFGTIVFAVMLCDMNYRVAFLTTTWNKYTIGSVCASFFLFGVYMLFYPSTQFVTGFLEPNMYMVPYHMFSNLIFWFCMIAVPAIAVVIDSFGNYAQRLYNPTLEDKAFQQLELKGSSLIHSRSDGSDSEGKEEISPARTAQMVFVCGDDDGAEANRDGYDGASYSKLDKKIDLTPFAQQSTRSSQCRIDGPLVLRQACTSGIVLMIMGGISLYMAGDVGQMRITYAGHGNGAWWWHRDPYGTDDTETWDVCQGQNSTQNCFFQLVAPRAMKAPIHVYYGVGPFYQNYHDYLKSEAVTELQGGAPSDVEAKRESKCIDQVREFVDTETSTVTAIRPCGMKATSFFNDTFAIKVGQVDVEIHQKGTAWPSDLDRYANPAGYPGAPADSSWLYERYPQSISEDEGVKNERFVNWMRPAAIPYIVNRYGYIEQDLAAGEEISIEIEANFPTDVLGAYKQLIITETNVLGGGQTSFGWLLLVSGILCWFVAIFVAITIVYCRLGDTDAGSSDEASHSPISRSDTEVSGSE